MITKEILEKMVIEAIKKQSGKASVLDVSKFIWDKYHDDLLKAGNILYTWQYDIRWIAVKLREKRILKQAGSNKRGVWELA